MDTIAYYYKAEFGRRTLRILQMEINVSLLLTEKLSNVMYNSLIMNERIINNIMKYK